MSPELRPTTIEATGEPAQELLVWGRVVVVDRLLNADEETLRGAVRFEARALGDDVRREVEREFLAEHARRKAARS